MFLDAVLINHLIYISIIIIFILLLIYFFIKTRKQKEYYFKLLKTISDNSEDAIVLTDNKTRITYINAKFTELTGYSYEEALGLPMNHFKSGKQDQDFYQKMWEELAKTGKWSGELWDKKKDGTFYPKRLTIIKLDKTNKNASYIGLFVDTKTEEQLKQYAQQLTLPNHKLITNLLRQHIQDNNPFYVIYFTIDGLHKLLQRFNFSTINVTKQLLTDVKGLLTGKDFVAQLNNYDFLAISCSLKSNEEVINLIEKLEENYHSYEEKLIASSIKFGISHYPNNNDQALDLVNDAYIALSRAKRNPNENYQFYHLQMKENLEYEAKIINAFRQGLENNEFYLTYQPQIEVKTQLLSGVEALVRWSNPEFGEISPNIFIPLAEQTGFVTLLGNWIINEAFKDYAILKSCFKGPFRLAINCSPLQLGDNRFLDKLVNLAHFHQVDLQNIEIEITEGLLVESVEKVNKQFDDLKKLGIRIALDDFGTGFSSLSYLQKLKVDKIKVDRSFIKDYPSTDSGAILNLIKSVADQLHFKTTIEGVETDKQYEYVKSLAYDYIQGYYYSKPLVLEQLVEFSKEYHKKSDLA